jgi:glycosyltransferase involved in cell wall biosynthesis/CelD/BcsL family acetyltransferase involved in cellulose biosynthesis
VLVLIDGYWNPHGGTEGQLRSFLSALPPTWRAEMWVLRTSPWLERNPFPCPTRRLRLGRLASPFTLARLARLPARVRRGRFDLVHTWMNDASLVGPCIAAAAGLPALVSRRDLGFWHTRTLVAALRRSGRLATAYVANGRAVADHVVASEHVPPAAVHVVPNGHPASAFDAPADEGLRGRLRIPADAVLVGLLANIKPLKRQGDLVEALARLGRAFAHVHVLLIGEGDGAVLHARARDLGVADRVHVEAVTGPIAPVLKTLDVGVLCSETEGLSNALIEYLGCGLPIVATGVGGNAEMVEHGENGFLYPVGDVEELTRSLRRILSDPSAAAQMGAASRRRFEARFLRERMVAETVALYERTIAPREPPAPLVWSVVTDDAGLEALEPQWRAILAPRRFFAGPVWVRTWRETLGKDARGEVLVGRDASGAIVGVLPLERRGDVLTTCGSGGGVDHFDVVAAPGEEERVAEGALDALLSRRWRTVRLAHVSEDAALRHALRRRRWRFPYGERLTTVCPYVKTTGTYAEWLATLSRKQRSRLLRAGRELVEHGIVRRAESPEEVRAALDTLFGLHERRFARKGVPSVFSGDAVRAFHARLAERLRTEGKLALNVLHLEGRPVAAHYAFAFRGRLHHFQQGFDPSVADRSPGALLLAHTLEHEAFGRGLDVYDFLDGAEAYKMSIATGVERLYDVTLYRPDAPGRARGLALGLASWAKDTLRTREPRVT